MAQVNAKNTKKRSQESGARSQKKIIAAKKHEEHEKKIKS